MLAVLEASQALSSETNLNLLRERIAEILTALTGATQVRVLLRDPDTGQWRLPDPVLLISGQLAVSLDNAVLYAELESKVAARTRKLEEVNDQLELLAITDPLTGLANRRHLMRVLSETWRAAARSQTPVGIAMIDIDHFKRYNDNYGHPAGDRCLRQVAAAIGRSIRDADLLARYGGEEFAIAVPGYHTTIAKVIKAADVALYNAKQGGRDQVCSGAVA
jgi:PleD family two-component response regulator